MEVDNAPPESTSDPSARAPFSRPIIAIATYMRGKLKQTLELSRIELPIAEHTKSYANKLSCAFKIRILEIEEPVSLNKVE